jgi:hypothetical protein
MSWRKNVLLLILVIALGSVLYFQMQRQNAVEEELPATLAPLPPERFTVLDTTIEAVQGLRITRSSDEFQAIYIREGDGSWSQTVPTVTVVLSQTMDTRMIGMINLVTARTLSTDSNPLSAYGLETPAYLLSVATLREDGATIRIAVDIGNLTPADDAYYIKVAGDPRVHIVPRGPLDNMIDLLESPPLPTPPDGS